MTRCPLAASLSALTLLLLPAVAAAQLDLPDLFTDGMVLQRGRQIPVWGTAEAGKQVEVTLNDHTETDTAAKGGRWRVDLPAMEAGGPHKLVIEAKDTRAVENVMIGEVWVCSGQSNMAWPLHNTNEAKQQGAVKKAEHANIRLFHLPRMAADEPQERLPKPVKWAPCTPKTARHFSAVGYFFGLKMRRALDVPIGLIQTAWGGSNAEAWTSAEALKARPQLRPLLDNRDKEGVSPNHTPAALHNAMLRPLIPYAIRGAVWYQGESNVGRPYQYRTLFPQMIRDWRDRWGQGDFPFYFVQLAPYDYGHNGKLPLQWESQVITHRKLPMTGIAVINDIGNPEDIHPRTKQPVGRRLARWALHQVHGRDIVPSGPLPARMTVEGEKAIVHFRHAGEGLGTRDGEAPRHFEVAGRGRKFHDAEARIEGRRVVVHSEKVAHPVAVRHAWRDVAEPNLINSAGLPASAFRTDGWAVNGE